MREKRESGSCVSRYSYVHQDLLPLYEQLLQAADDWATKAAAADAVLLLATHLRSDISQLLRYAIA
ncbi:hypothetical protein TGRUB_433870, partial [Toxoplasma gondii RUB]